ncbi:hypothetical protein HOY80DRAFT_948974 [Tuber brumale]|nr:hypothetical protein HOY80DRAFT_948974 [Tuber brumale]
MKFVGVFLTCVLLVEVSQAAPIWLTGVTHPVGSSPKAVVAAPRPRPIEKQLTPEQADEMEYRKKRLNDYLESDLIQLFDKHDIVPEEHQWGGPARPFNADEYFRIRAPSERSGIPWKKMFNRVLDFFSSGDQDAYSGLKTTVAEEGSVKADSELMFENSEDDTGSQDADSILQATFGLNREGH